MHFDVTFLTPVVFQTYYVVPSLDDPRDLDVLGSSSDSDMIARSSC